MTTNSTPHESKMMAEVRRWRQEAYEADQARSSEERAQRFTELLNQFGLTTKRIDANSRCAKPPDGRG